jgi:hypothetical protein
MSARLAYSMLSSGRLLSQSPATIFLAPARICCACYVTLSHDIEPKFTASASVAWQAVVVVIVVIVVVVVVVMVVVVVVVVVLAVLVVVVHEWSCA